MRGESFNSNFNFKYKRNIILKKKWIFRIVLLLCGYHLKIIFLKKINKFFNEKLKIIEKEEAEVVV